jgi:hypothetical protein
MKGARRRATLAEALHWTREEAETMLAKNWAMLRLDAGEVDVLRAIISKACR